MSTASERTITNGEVEAAVTVGFGPRVTRYAFAGGENVLGECKSDVVATDWGDWRPYGGHRLWTAPEATPRSYEPDDDPVEFYESDAGRTVRLLQPTGRRSLVQKEMVVSLDELGTGLTVTHRVTNRGAWEIELSAWALTIMRGGGEALIPQEPFGPHPECLLPARALVLWPYTDMTDSRFGFGRRFLRVRCNPVLKAPQKIGVTNKRGWAAYRLGDTLFVKRFGFEEGAAYPDLGCNNEVFTAGDFIEVESLSPLRRLAPGASVEHVERWHLFRGFSAGEGSDDELGAALTPLLAGAGVDS